MRTQSVPYEGMQEIYIVACDTWKKKIQEWTTPFTATKLSAKQVEEMYKAANDSQKETLDKWLNQGDKLQKELDSLILPYPNPQDQTEKAANALIKLVKIATHYNNGKKLNWKDPNQYKYMPYRYYDNGRWSFGSVRCWYLGCDFPVACCFVRSEDAKTAYETYPEIYDDFYMFEN